MKHDSSIVRNISISSIPGSGNSTRELIERKHKHLRGVHPDLLKKLSCIYVHLVETDRGLPSRFTTLVIA